MIAQSYCELQTVWGMKNSTLSCTEIVKISIMHISPYIAETIYKVMIEPVLFYCNNVMLGISDSTAARFQKIQDRAHKVVFGKRERSNTWETVTCKRNRLFVLEVFKCLNGIASINFNEYFSKNCHEKNTVGIIHC